jgi:hypothetical protein
MEILSSQNEPQEHHANVDLVRRRLLKLAAYSVPAMLTVSFLPVEKAFAEPNAQGGTLGSPESPQTPASPVSPVSPVSPASPASPKSPQSPTSPASATTSTSTTSSPETPKTPLAGTKLQSTGTVTSGTNPSPAMSVSANSASASSEAGSRKLNGWQAWLEFLQQLGLLK